MRPCDNPFRASRIESLAFRAQDGTSVASILDRLRDNGGRGAIVGPHGSGKTTLLDALERILARDGLDGTPLDVQRAQLRDECTRLDGSAVARTCGAGAPVALVIDGADLLPWPQWLALRWRARSAAALLVTSHARPLLPPIHRTTTSVALLESLVRELLDDASLTGPTGAELDRLLHDHRGDIRNALRALYDRWAVADRQEADDSKVAGLPGAWPAV